jgi:hypothetical protein
LLNSLIEELNNIDKREQNKICLNSMGDLDLNSSILTKRIDCIVSLIEEPQEVTTSLSSGMDLSRSISTNSIEGFVPITSNNNSAVSNQIVSALDLDILQQQQTNIKNNVVESSLITPIDSLNCALYSNKLLTQTTLDLTSLNQIKLNSSILTKRIDGIVSLIEEPTKLTTSLSGGMDLSSSISTNSIEGFNI